jgi:metal-dependent HD superfamily phosphatase/phosphodiesterase
MKRFDELRSDAGILELIEASNRVLAAMNYTDHGRRHVTLVARTAAKILQDLGFDEQTQDLAAIAALLHDIGNVAGRNSHAAAGATMAYTLLTARGFSVADAADVAAAIGNHDESEHGVPVNVHGAALIIADKADIHRSRVRTSRADEFDIHDRVNHAVTNAQLKTDASQKHIALDLTADLGSATLAEIVEIFESRFTMSAAAARFLGCSYAVRVNGEPVTVR